MYLVLDTETTGLPKRRNASYTELDEWPRVVTISWALFRSRTECISHRHHIVRPVGFRIPVEASRIHGVAHAKAEREGQPLASVLTALQSEISQCRPTMLVCHNVAFDRPIVLAEFLRAGMSPSVLASLSTYCTMETTADLCEIPGYSGFKFPSLQELYTKLFERSMDGAHNAAHDVLACAACFFELNARGHRATQRSQSAQRANSAAANQAHAMLNRVQAFARRRPGFDTTFVDSLQSQLEERGFLSERQMAALNKIINTWSIK